MKTLHQFDEVFDTQAVFRKVLEAMSNPTRNVSVAAQMEKLFGGYRAFLALGMTLLDNEVTFSACGDDAFRRDLQLVTLSQEAQVSDADYLFVTDPQKLSAVMVQAKCGTLTDPHKSAALLIRDNGEMSETVILFGPGIQGETAFHCSATALRALELRDQQAYEYPMGVDLIFVTDSGDVTCIPRLVRRRDSQWHM